jgi:hypothetical protein
MVHTRKESYTQRTYIHAGSVLILNLHSRRVSFDLVLNPLSQFTNTSKSSSDLEVWSSSDLEVWHSCALGGMVVSELGVNPEPPR